MPYTKDNPPDRIKGLPEHAQAIWIAAFNAAVKEYEGDEEKANATAWAAVKKAGYKKNEDGKWMKMQEASEVLRFGELVFEEEIDFDKPIEVWRIGDYPQGCYDKSDLDHIVSTFDPFYFQPAVVKDHQELGPACGWVKEIFKKGGSLWATFKKIPETVKEEIRQGLWKKISIALFPDLDGKGLALRHVSLLGAAPPQVRGLQTWQDRHGEFICFAEFAATEDQKKTQKARAAKYGISILEDGNVTKPSRWSNVPDDEWADPVNYAYPCPSKEQTQAALQYWGMPRNKEQYSSKDQGKITERLRRFAKKHEVKSEILKHSEEDMTQEEVQKLVDAQKAEFDKRLTAFTEETDGKIKKLTDENAELKKTHQEQFSEGALKAKEARIDGIVKQLLDNGKITPAYVDAGFKKFLMAQQEDTELTFGEGDDAKKIKVLDYAIELFSNKIKGAPVVFEELTKPGDKKGATGIVHFSVVESNGERNAVSKDSFELSSKAATFAKENKVSFKEALIEVSREPVG